MVPCSQHFVTIVLMESLLTMMVLVRMSWGPSVLRKLGIRSILCPRLGSGVNWAAMRSAQFTPLQASDRVYSIMWSIVLAWRKNPTNVKKVDPRTWLNSPMVRKKNKFLPLAYFDKNKFLDGYYFWCRRHVFEMKEKKLIRKWKADRLISVRRLLLLFSGLSEFYALFMNFLISSIQNSILKRKFSNVVFQQILCLWIGILSLCLKLSRSWWWKIWISWRHNLYKMP